MYLSENIRFLRKKHHLSQEDLARELGYKSFTTIQKWEKANAKPPLAVLMRLAELFSVDLNDLTSADLTLPPAPAERRAIRVPVLGSVAAGLPIEAVENVIDYEEIPAEWGQCGEYFALRIRGESMSPRILEGDIVIVRKQSDADSGDIVIALVNGEATCKKLKKAENGLLLIPFNPAFEPMLYSGEEVAALPVTILGKVVELRGKLC